MVGSILRRKLLRDMWSNRMQFLAVILLCALGTWVFSGLDATWRMLDLSSDTYFESRELADFWITLANADRDKLNRIKRTEGIADAQARVTMELETELPGEPTLVIEAVEGAPRINLPLIRAGEELDESDMRGCLMDEAFALANGLEVGDKAPVKLNGQTYHFVVRGLCLSAEFTTLSKNIVPDPKDYGFAYISAKAVPMLKPNNVVATLAEGADKAATFARLTALYPEALIVDRVAQRATHGIKTDVDMFRSMSYVFPLLAFAVAAMIVLTTITRMLENQRMQMGTLKALGYRDRQIRAHYLSYAFYPSLLGSAIGLAVGRATLPNILWDMETARFTIPIKLQAPISAAQWAVCAAGVMLACAICLNTYNKSACEQTAALLRPKPLKAGRKLLLERAKRLWGALGFNGKMISRNMFRNKARTLMSLMGALCCTMLIITSLGLQDSVAYFVGKYYYGTLRYTVRAELDAGGELQSYEKRIAAERVEGEMAKTVSARVNGRSRTVTLSVLMDDQRLLYLGEDESYLPLPEDGVLVTEKLMQALGAKTGDTLELWLAGDDEPVTSVISGVAHTTVGLTVYMRKTLWEKALKGDFAPTSLFVLEPTAEGLRRLSELDELSELRYPPDEYEETMKVLNSMMGVFNLMSGAALGLAFVVLYNMGILNYTERYREYATLKVLGYHQREIRGLILNESELVSGLGVLLGILPGRWLTDIVLQSCENDSMLFVSTVSPKTVLLACASTFAFSLLITLFLTRRVRSIDMVEALKSVE